MTQICVSVFVAHVSVFPQIAIDPLLNDLKSVKEPVAKLVPQTVNFFTNIRVQLGFVAEAAARDARGAD